MKHPSVKFVILTDEALIGHTVGDSEESFTFEFKRDQLRKSLLLKFALRGLHQDSAWRVV
jgi:hypothetical protein